MNGLNSFASGFLFCLCLVLMLALTQQNTRYRNEVDILKEFQNLYQDVQSKDFIVKTTTPTLANMNEKEILFISTQTVNLVTRIGQNRYKVEMSTF